MRYAIYGHTIAEIIMERASSEKEYMGLTVWQDEPDGKIKRSDVTVVKNYLTEFELSQLNYMDSAKPELLDEILNKDNLTELLRE